MNGEPLRRTITITNLQGLHLRPLTKFAQLALRFQSEVYLQHAKETQRRVSGKSALAMLEILAPQGTEIVVETAGPDQQEAMEALAAFLANLAEEEDKQSETSVGDATAKVDPPPSDETSR
jgi:phosphocarrier protein